MSVSLPESFTPMIKQQFENAKLVDQICSYRGTIVVDSPNWSQMTSLHQMEGVLRKIASCKKLLDRLAGEKVHECGSVIFDCVRVRHMAKDGRGSIKMTKVCLSAHADFVKLFQRDGKVPAVAIPITKPITFYVMHNGTISKIKLSSAPEVKNKALSIPLSDQTYGHIWDVSSHQIANLANELTDNSLLIAQYNSQVIQAPSGDLAESLLQLLENK